MADLDDIKDGKDFRTDQPQQNIPFTLKGCGALDWGMQSRLSRIFNPKTGNTVMLAFDHGYFQGPTTGLERIDINIAKINICIMRIPSFITGRRHYERRQI